MRWVRLTLLSLSVLASGGTFSALATLANAEAGCQADCQSKDDACPPLCPGCSCGHVVSFIDSPEPTGLLLATADERVPCLEAFRPDDAPKGRLFEPPRA